MISRLPRPAVLMLSALAGGCCRSDDPPVWDDLDPYALGEGTETVSLLDWVDDKRPEKLVFSATSDGDVHAELDGDALSLTAQPDFVGTATVTLTATDRCGNEATVDLAVAVGVDPDAPGCQIGISYPVQGSPDRVVVAGSWNDWDTESDPLTDQGDGTWAGTLTLEPGAYPYKLVEVTDGLYEDEEGWTCDPSAALIQCDADYIEPWETDWSQDCTLNSGACNSLLVVEDCRLPTLALTALDLDRDARTATLTARYTPGIDGAAANTLTVTLDGEGIDADFDGEWISATLTGLSAARHRVEIAATDAAGGDAAPVVVPFWMDGRDWQAGALYYAFVDRVANGDLSNDEEEGASFALGEYQGGDWQGLIDLLPYLDDLGVTALWLANAQDNAEGAWSGDCDGTYAGYHAYWPDDPTATEEHFGDEATLHALVDAAHARGMRVLMDWVANHVHEDHPYYQDHADTWFNDYEYCKDYVDGTMNFDRVPETCWFAPYLPDIDYVEPDALVAMVDDALWWAEEYDLDGFRVDAAKHMPHSVQWNLESLVQQRLEHRAAGGDEEFWTVGETFDSYDRIAAYMGDNQLDGQFDFPLYYSIQAAFAEDSISLPDLMDAVATSEAAFSGALMGTFLGNHDVQRFVTVAAGDSVWELCDGAGGLYQAEAPDWDDPYDRLRLAWSFLFTQPGVPLVYYGDELGMPGYGDPDNRQPLWWAVGDLGDIGSVDDMAGALPDRQGRVVRHVAALANARKTHEAMYAGDTVEWWQEDDVYATARTTDDDAMLVILNRSTSDRTLDNGLSFAGLPTTGTYTDALTGDTFTPSGDGLAVDVGAMDSRVLVWEP